MLPKKHTLWFHALDVLLNIVIILAIVGLIRTFLVSPFQVEGNSMLSTLEDNEYIIINKLAYYIGEPRRGDVVVFRPPTDQKKHYVKRVIGLPGETVILRGGYVFIQRPGAAEEVQLKEDYLSEANRGHTFQHPPSSGNRSEIRFAVPEEHYFLMGDNRQGSLDSRSFAMSGGDFSSFVPEGDIAGRVWLVALPVTKIHAVGPTRYEELETGK
ncbi:MAG: signal peptidase I [Candidatus Peribacteraceae bacterium]|nr:signal peptidase I [Candidatus Peribacteraceae bacterium]